MLNFCLPETTLKKVIIELQDKKNGLEKSLNETNTLIDEILKLQGIDVLHDGKNPNKEIKLSQEKKLN